MNSKSHLGFQVSKSVRLSGATAVARAIKECGVDHFFYVTGGMMPLFPAIEAADINTVLCRNEKAACNMADGYSRVTKRPSVCYAQHGAAAAILASMLYEPMASHSPVIALTGSTPTKKKDFWSYQECYEMPYFESTCKFNVDVTDVERLAEYMRTAIQMAVTGCPGPTHVNMHLDMASVTAEMPEVYGNEMFFKVPPFRPRAEPEKVAAAAKLLGSAENPILVCGTGVHLSGAYDEVRQLAELLSIPVVTNYRGKGSFPEEHPLYVGVMGAYGSKLANDIVRESDLVFFIAARAEGHMTEDMTAPKPGASKIIQLDIDPATIGRMYRPDVALVGDAKLTLRDLLQNLNVLAAKPKQKYQRLQMLGERIKEYQSILNSMMDSDATPIKPQRMMKEISRVLKSRDVVVSDTGFMICWTTRFLKMKGTGMTYMPCGGTLGSSFATAMGASFGAANDQRILNLIGDGGIAYNLADLETARRYNDKHAPIVFLVNNNSSLAQTRPGHEDWTKKSAPWINSSDFTEMNYAKIAEAFGCYGVRVERPSEIFDALQGAFDSGRPAIVDVVTDKREYAPIGLPGGTRKEPSPGFPPY